MRGREERREEERWAEGDTGGGRERNNGGNNKFDASMVTNFYIMYLSSFFLLHSLSQ